MLTATVLVPAFGLALVARPEALGWLAPTVAPPADDVSNSNVVRSALEELRGTAHVEVDAPLQVAEPATLRIVPDVTSVELPTGLLRLDLPGTPRDAENGPNRYAKVCDLLRTYGVQAGTCPANPRDAVPEQASQKLQEDVRNVLRDVFDDMEDNLFGADGYAGLVAAVDALGTVPARAPAGTAPRVGPAAVSAARRVPVDVSRDLLARIAALADPPTPSATDTLIRCVIERYASGERSDTEAVEYRDYVVQAARNNIAALPTALACTNQGTLALTAFTRAVRALLPSASLALVETKMLQVLTGSSSDLLTQVRSGDATATLSAVQLAELLENLEVHLPRDLTVSVCVHWTFTRSNGLTAPVRLQNGASEGRDSRTSTRATCRDTNGGAVTSSAPDQGVLLSTVSELSALIEPEVAPFTGLGDLAAPTTSDVSVQATVSLRLNETEVWAPLPPVTVPVPRLPVPGVMLAFAGTNFGPATEFGSSVFDLSIGDRSNCIHSSVETSVSCRQGFLGLWGAVPASSPIEGPQHLVAVFDVLAPIVVKLAGFARFASFASGLALGVRVLSDVLARIGDFGVGFVWTKMASNHDLNGVKWVRLSDPSSGGNSSDTYDIEVEDEVRSMILFGGSPIYFWEDGAYDGHCVKVAASDSIVLLDPDTRTNNEGNDPRNAFSSFSWELDGQPDRYGHERPESC